MRVLSTSRRVYTAALSSLIAVAALAYIAAEDGGVISFDCEGTTCLECLNNGCGWFPAGGEPDNPGECVTTCSIIADAPCYAEEYFTGQSPQAICNIVTTDENDWNKCSAVTDCASCTSTVKTDGSSNCVWYEVSENCGSGQCNFLGCGSSTCPKDGDVNVGTPVQAPTVLKATEKPAPAPVAPIDLDNPISRPLPPSSEDKENPTLKPNPVVVGGNTVCDRLSNADCTTCISSGCGYVNDEICVASCRNIADIACYDNTTYPNMSTASEICTMLLQEPLEVSPTSSPGEVSAFECETTASTCNACLDAGCGWISGNICLASCNVIADIACYDQTTFASVTTTNVTEICTLVEQSENDAALCLAQQSCSDCRAIQLSVPENRCSWYEASDDTSFPSICCIGLCDFPAVLTTTCSNSNSSPTIFDPKPWSPTQSPSTTQLPSSTQGPTFTQPPSFTLSPSITQLPSTTQSPSGSQLPTVLCDQSVVTSCDTCLSTGCAYIGGEICVSSCDVIADTSCFDTTTFPNVTNVAEICRQVERLEIDATTCSDQNTCNDCLSTSLTSGPENSCTWFSVREDPAQSRCCFGCFDPPGTPVTSITTCDAIATELESQPRSAAVVVVSMPPNRMMMCVSTFLFSSILSRLL